MRKTGLLVAFSVLLLFATGCWNRRELNDLAIAVAVGIDKADNNYRVSVQVVDPSEVAAKKGGGTRTPVTMYQSSGQTIMEAIRRMTTVSPRKIYASHLRMLVVQEQVAKEGIGEVLDLLSRDHEVRTDFYIVVAKDTRAADTLKILTHLESIPANHLFSSLQTSQRSWSPTVAVTLDRLIADIVSEGKNPAVTGLRVKGEREIGETRQNVEEIAASAQLQYSGLAVFKKDKLVGWLDETESKAYNYILDQVTGSAGIVPCPGGGKVSLEVVRSKTKVKSKLENGEPRIKITVQIELSVSEVTCGIDLTKRESIEQLEKLEENKVRNFITETIKRVQRDYQSDIFGFGDVIHRSHPKYWKTAKADWDRRFAQLPVDLNVESNIRLIGTESSSFLKEMKKKE
ncbi:Ger(x)C family spore germination protein [Paenibacillus thailandensis]|uniref:Ger(X)C family spore germination protein n=1 Tax=Paenibacillus thailandensis TaxID=393250 RepID=A0ABW5R1A7_9BACL